jgi:hypothetical protein
MRRLTRFFKFLRARHQHHTRCSRGNNRLPPEDFKSAFNRTALLRGQVPQPIDRTPSGAVAPPSALTCLTRIADACDKQRMTGNEPEQQPKSVGERCLLGWFSRADAIKHLTEEVVYPKFDEQSAAAAWEDYQRRVHELPERGASAPERLPLTAEEQVARTAFMHKHRGAANIRDVIKIDPCSCVAVQLLVITDRAEIYSASTQNPADKIRHCLGTDQPEQIPLTMTPAVGGARIPLPHAEFAFGILPNGSVLIQQLARHISVGAFQDLMLLTGGYHRSFALSSLHNPEAIERSLVVALTTDVDALLAPDSPNQTVRELVRSLRPPLFADFFDDRLAMSLRVRKRRPELWIQGQIRWFDDPS